MTEEEIELMKFLMTDYGRGYLAGLASGLSMLLKILKKQSKYPTLNNSQLRKELESE